MSKKEHKSEEYLAINPFGKLPALTCGDVTVVRDHSCATHPMVVIITHTHTHTQFESGAILLYLAEIVGGADTAAKRAELAQWVLFANSTLVCFLENSMLVPSLLSSRCPPRCPPCSPTQYDALFQPSENTTLAKVMEPLDSILSKKTYLIGDALTAADIAVGSSLLYAQMFIKV